MSMHRWIEPALEASAELAEAFGYDGWATSEASPRLGNDVRGGLISIVGDGVLLQIALLTDGPTARSLAAGMLQMPECEVDDALVADSMCELANVMAGSLKSRASADGSELRLGLPVHVAGNIDAPPGASQVTLTHAWQGRTIDLLLIERESGG